MSGICSNKGDPTLDSYLDKLGFKLKYGWTPKIKTRERDCAP